MKDLTKFAIACVFLIALSTVSATAQETLFRSTIVGSNPNEIIAGVLSGGLPWQVTKASTSLSDEGRLAVKLTGLILTGVGNPGPVTQVSASLVCGGSGGAVAATTNTVALSAEGDADFHQKLTLPSRCLSPVVIVRVAGVKGTLLPLPGPFIAASGFNSSNEQ
jgi:hypothetical protein